MPKLDPLTGLLDGQNLERRLDALLDRADDSGQPVSLVIADLGGLKAINVAFGREAGDRVLREVANTLSATAPETGLCFRLGGDAFVLLLPGMAAAAAAEAADSLRGAIARTRVTAESGYIALRASTGVSTYPQDAQTARSILRAADRRMQASRAPGLDSQSAS